MANTRELSQLASLINVNDETKSIRVIADQPDAKIGIGTANPISKVDISGDANISGVITAVSFYGDGSNLTGLSTFSGNYNDLTNTPTVLSTFSNDVGFVTSSIVVGYATEGYVDIAVANLVNSAPETLDTLSELATALGNDENFSTTITNSLANKADLSGANFTGVVTATSFYGDGSNLQGIVSVSGVGISSNGTLVGTGITSIDFVGVAITSIEQENGFATIRLKDNDGVSGIEIVDDISLNFNGTETTFSLTSGQTPISIAKPQQLIVNLGGVLQSPGVDYYTSSSSITFTTPPQQGLTFSAVSIGVLVQVSPLATPGKKSSTKIATEGQTVFSALYEVGGIDVFLNGIRLSNSEYTATNGTSITLAESASANDVLDVVEYLTGIGATGPAGPVANASLTIGTRSGAYTQNAVGTAITISLRSGIGTASF